MYCTKRASGKGDRMADWQLAAGSRGSVRVVNGKVVTEQELNRQCIVCGES